MSINLLKRTTMLAGIILVHFTVLTAQTTPAASPAQSISPEKRALIAQLLVAINVRKSAMAVYDTMLDQEEKLLPDLVWQGIEKRKEVQGLSSEKKADLRKKLFETSNRTRKRMNELFAERVDLAGVMEEVSTELYDRHFNEAEIKDLIAFYSSPTGKKSIEVMPKMFAESMNSTADRLRPTVLAIITQLSEEEAKRVKYELQKTSPPAKANPKRRSTRTRKSHH